ncbi:hypothetical protein EXIGLDRAFT_699629 [Exidia glandulosa HHB12029]|uniref:Helicase ATP-binding domain-containing protein n=1 Tax=Exidia glandulosa HHB12029 TaxID=1314781 RepID=A0A165DTB6_EXIGL|nr:hypothetical protein EXIGLDRAFT_699629 [Exidia glandulosa HHB12029]
MKKFFDWPHDARPMQEIVGVAQAVGGDVMVHAPTGLGKTGIVAAPHVFPENKGRVSLFISPLIALQEEMVTTFNDDFKLTAVAVNSTRTKSLNKTLNEICTGKYAIVLLSPEMLQSRRFIDRVLRNAEFSRRFLSLVVDEAHTVSHWGAHFRKKYTTIGIVRTFLPRGTSVIAMSASLTPRVRRDVAKKLQLSASYTFLDYGNNRPNVSLVARACHRSLKSYKDLDFVIPSDVQSPSDIPSTFVYADVKEDGDRIIDHLRELLPPSMRDLGLIRPFNASLSHSYRKDALLHFKAGNIRVMVCTDAAGMRLSSNGSFPRSSAPSSSVQAVQRGVTAQLGLRCCSSSQLHTANCPHFKMSWPARKLRSRPRLGRGRAREGKRVQQGRCKGYAKAHGRSRGEKLNSTTNNIDRTITLVVNDEAEDEGLLVFVQTGDCRRRVICDAFHNDKDRTHTLPGTKQKQKPRKEKLDVAEDVVTGLRDWRYRVWSEDYSDRGFSEIAILSDELILSIAQTELNTLLELQNWVAEEWDWWPEYGPHLWHALATIYDTRSNSPCPASVSTPVPSPSVPVPPAVLTPATAPAQVADPPVATLSLALVHTPAPGPTPTPAPATAKRKRVQAAEVHTAGARLAIEGPMAAQDDPSQPMPSPVVGSSARPVTTPGPSIKRRKTAPTPSGSAS